MIPETSDFQQFKNSLSLSNRLFSQYIGYVLALFTITMAETGNQLNEAPYWIAYPPIMDATGVFLGQSPSLYSITLILPLKRDDWWFPRSPKTRQPSRLIDRSIDRPHGRRTKLLAKDSAVNLWHNYYRAMIAWNGINRNRLFNTSSPGPNTEVLEVWISF